MQHVVVVCDVGNSFNDNVLFDSSLTAQNPGMGYWRILKELLVKKGISVVSSNNFLSHHEKYKYHTKLLVSDMYTPDTSDLIQKGCLAAIILSTESPNVALSFYSRLIDISSNYKSTFLYSGFENKVSTETTFHRLYWPNSMKSSINQKQSWSSKDLLVMVASNKRRFDVNPDKPFLGLRRFIKDSLLILNKVRNPLLRIKDLYQVRLDAILYFSYTSDFKLFGTRWNEPFGISKKYHKAALRAGGLKCGDKIKILSQYKFNLCFENCIYPGYITEKIFDCFFSGTIPIYYGAPDITDFIPKGCFIDFRDFSNFRELDSYIRSIDENEANKYLKNASTFLKSNSFKRFTDNFLGECMAQEIIKLSSTSKASLHDV